MTSYPNFETIMAEYPEEGLEWEGIPVTTSDGYQLTLFHIWSTEAADITKDPVYWQHGGGMSADDWITAQASEVNPFFELAHAGHHVYLGTNRGSLYSQGHDTLDRVTDAASYWDFYVVDYATDVLAFGAGVQTK